MLYILYENYKIIKYDPKKQRKKIIIIIRKILLKLKTKTLLYI